MNSKINYILLILVGCVINAQGQNIDHLFNELDQNLSLIVFDKESEAQSLSAEQYIWLPDPEFSAGVFPLPVETRLGSQLFRLSAMQMIPNKNLSKQKEKIALLKAEPFKQEKEIKIIALKAGIKDAYLDYYLLVEQQHIISRNLNILSSLEEIALSRVESGKGRMSEVLFIQAKKQEVSDKLLVLKEKERAPLAKINTLLYRSTDTKIPISQHLDFPEWSGNIHLENWQNNHPSFALIDDYKAILRSETELEIYNQKPIWAAGLDYIFINPRSDAEPRFNGRDVVQLKASVSIPLNKDPYRARNQSRLVKEEALELKKQDIEQAILRNYETGLAQYQAAQLSWQLSENQINTIVPTITILEKEYAAQKASIEMIISLEMDKIKYEIQQLESIISAYKAINSIENLTL